MMLHFYIKYKTHYGQSLIIRVKQDAGTEGPDQKEISLNYLDNDYWYGNIETEFLAGQDFFKYQYIIRENGQNDITDLCQTRSIHFRKIESDEVYVLDDWQEYRYEEYVFNSKPFAQVFETAKVKEVAGKKPTHIFEVTSSQLPDDKVLCICGAGKKLNDWDLENPVLLKHKKHAWSVKLNLSKEAFPLEYKFGVYDTRLKKAVFLEDGSNRVLHQFGDKNAVHVLHQFTQFRNFSWKGAGVNVQLSALKTAQSWGVGDFTDLNTLTDWSIATGFKMIQLLPINDTISNHDKTDSYPYSAISAFALHPVFLNVQKLATAANVELPAKTLRKVKELNALGSLDYEEVAKLKLEAINMIYQKEKHSFKDDFAYFDFFDLNRHWLVPYAAFSYLRDSNKSADYANWGNYAVYDEDKIQELVSPDHPHYEEVAIHYFTQYHLHLQLLDAVEYAHKNGVIIKGDLPIGVGRHSVDTWMYPHLFHMDMQAGAPPDAFTIKGQNWSFPTYNWELMKIDDYAWWRQRMEHMSNYFDAIRIDHVLGFFRIWSIPMYAVEGIFGRFIPTIPLYADDFSKTGIYFDEQRFCSPFINDDIMFNLFGEHTSYVRQHFLDGNQFKPAFDTQEKVAAYFSAHPEKDFLKQPLFDLLCNIILLKDEGRNNAYHFRISMQMTSSYSHLSGHEQQLMTSMYHQYFFETQNGLWYREVQSKLDAIQKSSSMLICAEDLGMVPEMVEDVLKNREMLSLQVQRMPKVSTENFTHPGNAAYLSVVTPSTHDMSTIRQWWEEDRANTQVFFNQILGHYGEAPFYCEPWIARDVILQHLRSPAMWAVFLLQDLMAINGLVRRENPNEERINIPADPNHYWNYRMHVNLEDLLENKEYCNELRQLVVHSGR